MEKHDNNCALPHHSMLESWSKLDIADVPAERAQAIPTLCKEILRLKAKGENLIIAVWDDPVYTSSTVAPLGDVKSAVDASMKHQEKKANDARPIEIIVVQNDNVVRHYGHKQIDQA